MKRRFFVFRIVFALLLLSSTLDAWEVALNRVGSETPAISSATYLLDPDDWSRKELAVFLSSNARPIAWLNLSQAEEGRTFILGIDPKLPIVHKKRKIKDRNPFVRFYAPAWKALLRERVREIAQKGFQGLFLTGIEGYRQVSDSPVSFQEMSRLITEISGEFLAQTPDGIIVLHRGTEFWEGAALRGAFHAAAMDGVWIDERGRLKHQWERSPMIARLRHLRTLGIAIFTIEGGATQKGMEFARNEAGKQGFDPAIASLPMTIRRAKIHGSD